ncbi:MAG: PGF-pre-PGF domain-containing protein, partial [ANME-2 cluster archaeon]|nr:PGF-pre-PGF domain-containing protein [ANME-2 cluster archaeon]
DTAQVTVSSGLAAEVAGPYSGPVGVAISFIGSASGGKTPYSYIWTFGDGGTSTVQNPDHPYTVVGTYTTTLNVTDANGTTAQDTAQVTVTTPKSSSGGSSGSSGTSGETFENILCSETDRRFISKDQEVSFNFELECNYVKYINFTGLSSFGIEATKVEILNHTSSLVSIDAPDIVFTNLNVWIGSMGLMSENNVENPTISFYVDKSWVEDNGITLNTIYFSSYDDSTKNWEKMPTQKIGEDSSSYYFKASLPLRINIGSMAISGRNLLSPSMVSSNSSSIPLVIPTQNDTVQPAQNNNSTIAPITWTRTLNEKVPPFQAFSAFFVIISLYIGMSLAMVNIKKSKELPAMVAESPRPAKTMPAIIKELPVVTKERSGLIIPRVDKTSNVPGSFWHREPGIKITPIKVPAPIPGRTSTQKLAVTNEDVEQTPVPEHSHPITKKYIYYDKLFSELPPDVGPDTTPNSGPNMEKRPKGP